MGRISGNNATWTFGSPKWNSMGQRWQTQLGSAGSVAQANLGALFRSREHWKLVPDINNTVMIAGRESGNTLAVAARTNDGQSLIAYIPTRRTMTIDLSKISDSFATAWWFDPRTASSRLIGKYPTTASRDFTTPDQTDWVLVIDAASANLPPPSKGLPERTSLEK